MGFSIQTIHLGVPPFMESLKSPFKIHQIPFKASEMSPFLDVCVCIHDKITEKPWEFWQEIAIHHHLWSIRSPLPTPFFHQGDSVGPEPGSPPGGALPRLAAGAPRPPLNDAAEDSTHGDPRTEATELVGTGWNICWIQICYILLPGWWFGTWILYCPINIGFLIIPIDFRWFGTSIFYFPINIGFVSSSQLTNSYFSEGWPNHPPG